LRQWQRRGSLDQLSLRLGVSFSGRPRPTPAGPDVQPFIDMVKRAEGYGYTRIAVADLQAKDASLECFTALTLMATITSRCQIGPSVTNPVTRDPGVMANAIASIDAISGGRAVLLIGRGLSAVQDAGLPPATLEELAEYVSVVQAILSTGVGTYRGRTIRGASPGFWIGGRPRKIPVHIAAEGPRMLRLAGALADGVLVASGLTADVVQDSLAQIEAGARSAGRKLADIDVWWSCRFSIALSRAEALSQSLEQISAAGNHSLRSRARQAQVPAELLPALREFHTRYDHTEKGQLNRPGFTNPETSRNATLMHELGLQDYFLERFGVVGSPAVLVDRLRQLQSIGVDQLVTRHDERYPESLALMGEGVLPHIA
jgi:5,10-methylenetetrahydromethanopterin reductase